MDLAAVISFCARVLVLSGVKIRVAVKNAKPVVLKTTFVARDIDISYSI